MIRAEKVLKKYGDLVALDGLSITVKEGEIYGLLGPNGSGKSTLINCILALLKYEKGSIEVFGEEMSPVRFDLKKDIGFVPQEISVIEELTVYENIDFFCGLYVKDKEKRKAFVEEAIAFVGLNDFRKFRPKKLSGGLKRRLNLACGIAHKPKLIILDEPTVAVDPQSRNLILEGILELNKKGVTIVYTTHYMEEVEKICSKISIIDKGRLLVTGTKDELKKAVGLLDSLLLEKIRLSHEEKEALHKLIGNAKIKEEGENLLIELSENLSLSHIFAFLERENIYFENMKILSPTLNDVFLEITGKDLRDE